MSSNSDSGGCLGMVGILAILYFFSGGGGSSPFGIYDAYDPYDEEDRYLDDYYSDGGEDGSIYDGTYTADVGYYNPNTGHSANYTLDVEIEGGYVTTIYFPRGGWLDDTHIQEEEIEEFEEYIYMYDDYGREWEVYVYE